MNRTRFSKAARTSGHVNLSRILGRTPTDSEVDEWCLIRKQIRSLVEG